MRFIDVFVWNVTFESCSRQWFVPIGRIFYLMRLLLMKFVQFFNDFYSHLNRKSSNLQKLFEFVPYELLNVFVKFFKIMFKRTSVRMFSVESKDSNHRDFIHAIRQLTFHRRTHVFRSSQSIYKQKHQTHVPNLFILSKTSNVVGCVFAVVENKFEFLLFSDN